MEAEERLRRARLAAQRLTTIAACSSTARWGLIHRPHGRCASLNVTSAPELFTFLRGARGRIDVTSPTEHLNFMA